MSSETEDNVPDGDGASTNGKKTPKKKDKEKDTTPSTTTLLHHPKQSASSQDQPKDTRKFAPRQIFFGNPNANNNSPPNSNNTQKAPSSELEPVPIVVPYIASADPKQESNEQVATAQLTLVKSLLKTHFHNGDYAVRNLKHCMQILVSNQNTHNETTALLAEKNIQFYSYSNTTVKQDKFVLYGLNNEDIGDIIQDLKEYGIIPVDIKKMRINTPKYTEQNNFIIYFDSDDRVTLTTLNKIRYICNTVISWAHYRQPKERSARQCKNCFRFNHDAATCKMATTCMMCAKHHATDDCPLVMRKKQLGAKSIPSFRLKCANCHGEHTAIFANCPRRISFIHKRTSVPSQQNPRKWHMDAPPPTTNPWKTQDITTQPRGPRVARIPQQHGRARSLSPPHIASTLENRQTPSLPPAIRHTASANVRVPRQTHRQNNYPIQTAAGKKNIDQQPLPQKHPLHTADKIVANSITHNSNYCTNHNNIKPKTNLGQCNIDINANPLSSITSTSSDTLFTPTELVSVFQEMMRSLQKCTTRADQLQALMEITLKYLKPQCPD